VIVLTSVNVTGADWFLSIVAVAVVVYCY